MGHISKDHDFGRFYHEIVDHGIWAELPGAAGKVYGVLLRHANYSTFMCFPSRETIVRESGVNKNKITVCLNQLKSFGLIFVKRSGKRFGFRNIYTIISHPSKPTYPITMPSKHTYPVYKDKRTGRFCKSLKAGNGTSPHPTDSNSCPSPEDKKEIKREKIETAQNDQILDSLTDPRLKKSFLSLRQTLERREAEG